MVCVELHKLPIRASETETARTIWQGFYQWLLTEEKVHLPAHTPQGEADVWAPGFRAIEEIRHTPSSPYTPMTRTNFSVEFVQAFNATTNGDMSLSRRDVSQEGSGEKPFPRLFPKANIPREPELKGLIGPMRTSQNQL